MYIIKEKLLSLDFYFISEIRRGIYEVLYAKDLQEEGTKVFISGNTVCFYSNEWSDNTYKIDISNIILKGLTCNE